MNVDFLLKTYIAVANQLNVKLEQDDHGDLEESVMQSATELSDALAAELAVHQTAKTSRRSLSPSSARLMPGVCGRC